MMPLKDDGGIISMRRLMIPQWMLDVEGEFFLLFFF